MRPYTFYLHDGVHPAPGFDFVQCEDEAEAFAHASSLLEQFNHYRFIEVYDGQHERRRVDRDYGRAEPVAGEAAA